MGRMRKVHLTFGQRALLFHDDYLWPAIIFVTNCIWQVVQIIGVILIAYFVMGTVPLVVTRAIRIGWTGQ